MRASPFPKFPEFFGPSELFSKLSCPPTPHSFMWCAVRTTFTTAEISLTNPWRNGEGTSAQPTEASRLRVSKTTPLSARYRKQSRIASYVATVLGPSTRISLRLGQATVESA